MTLDNFKSEKNALLIFSDYLDLTIAQIFVLILLGAFPEGAIRYTILQNLNDLFPYDKRLSPSSFYNSLSKLEKKGLIEFIIDESNKISLIKITSKANDVLQQIGHITILSSKNLKEWISSIAQKIIEYANVQSPVDSVLVISQDLTLDLHLYPYIEKYAKQIHTLANDDDFERYIKPYSEKIHQTVVLNNLIREPNDIFNATFLPSYQGHDNYYGLTTEILLSEAVRVTKPKGMLIFTAFSKPKKVDSFLIDSLIDIYISSPFLYIISKDDLREDMVKAGLENISIIDNNGIIIGIGTIPG